MKLSLTYLMVLLILAVQTSMVEAAKDYALPLKCTAIPSLDEQLCYATTASPLGPYDDVVFYRKTIQQALFLLGSVTGGVAGFGGAVFSEGGKYMWLEWTEEGHPDFSFYSTQSFLSDGLAAPAIDTLDSDGFSGLISFSDNGRVLYTKDEDDAAEDDMAECKKTPCVYVFDLNKAKSVTHKK